MTFSVLIIYNYLNSRLNTLFKKHDIIEIKIIIGTMF